MRDGSAFVTGGSSGIGLAAAKQLARDHARVAIFARDGARLERAVALAQTIRMKVLLMPRQPVPMPQIILAQAYMLVQLVQALDKLPFELFLTLL